jgi:hypothetical protein
MHTVAMSELHFPVLLLAGETPVPRRHSWGGREGGPLKQFEVVYFTGRSGDEPWLCVKTEVRDGCYLDENGELHVPYNFVLVQRAWQSATQVLDAPQAGVGALNDAAVRAMGEDNLEGRAVAEECGVDQLTPLPPWELQSLDLDGSTYAMWILRLNDDRFAFAADCGPSYVTGHGYHLGSWDLSFTRVSPAEARSRIRDF